MTAKDYIHKEFPKECATSDFKGQIKRTVNGKPVSEEQILMILNAIRSGINISKNDVLLDLCCGNGDLANAIFPEISAYKGVDFSDYLIQVAKENFEKMPDFEFNLADALEYSTTENNPERFTKALCYGAFQYLPAKSAENLLKNINQRFKNIKVFFIGNLPDKERADKFYYADIDYKPLLGDNTSPIGIWRSKDEMIKLAVDTGWDIEIINMPQNFYAAHYRYDAKLTRK